MRNCTSLPMLLWAPQHELCWLRSDNAGIWGKRGGQRRDGEKVGRWHSEVGEGQVGLWVGMQGAEAGPGHITRSWAACSSPSLLRFALLKLVEQI